MREDRLGETLVLSKHEVETFLPLPELVEGIEAAYAAYSADRSIRPQRAVGRVGESSVVINFPGALPGHSTFTVKANVKTPGNVAAGLPFLIGTILLIDRGTGVPLAIFESSLITAMRTGAAGAVGARALARRGAGRVALLGAGTQGAWQLRALHAVGRLASARVYDLLPGRAVDLAARMSAELAVPVLAAPTLAEAAADADILVAVTQSRTPVVTADLVRPGMHVNAFGADEPGKVEVDADVLLASVVVADDRELALSDGALNVARSSGRVADDVVHAEIGEVLAGRRRGRESDEQVTVFANVGLAFQDLVACQIVYGRAIQAGAGTRVHLQ